MPDRMWTICGSPADKFIFSFSGLSSKRGQKTPLGSWHSRRAVVREQRQQWLIKAQWSGYYRQSFDLSRKESLFADLTVQTTLLKAPQHNRCFITISKEKSFLRRRIFKRRDREQSWGLLDRKPFRKQKNSWIAFENHSPWHCFH